VAGAHIHVDGVCLSVCVAGTSRMRSAWWCRGRCVSWMRPCTSRRWHTSSTPSRSTLTPQHSTPQDQVPHPYRATHSLVSHALSSNAIWCVLCVLGAVVGEEQSP
jgi:hypothetical protein